MRLFIAFDLPPSERDRLAALLPEPAPGLRRVPSGRMHVTMRWIGDVTGETRQELARGLVRMPMRTGSAVLRGVGTFPDRGRPRVLWAGVEPDPAIVEAREAVEELCREAGLPDDVTRWTPHVTLGRFRGSRPAWLADFAAQNQGIASDPFAVDRIVLYDSLPDSSGVRYEEVAVCRAR